METTNFVDWEITATALFDFLKCCCLNHERFPFKISRMDLEMERKFQARNFQQFGYTSRAYPFFPGTLENAVPFVNGVSGNWNPNVWWNVAHSC